MRYRVMPPGCSSRAVVANSRGEARELVRSRMRSEAEMFRRTGVLWLAQRLTWLALPINQIEVWEEGGRSWPTT